MTMAGAAGDALNFQQSDIKRVLGERVGQLIEVIAYRAHNDGLSLYLVGGVVRDLLLNKRNLDLDFALEGDAIRFSKALAKHNGGTVQAHKPFGTAKWTLHGSTTKVFAGAQAELPAHLDFVTARCETFECPAALPTVSPSDIRHDMLRRDFSVNALAIQISPHEQAGRVLDFCGGADDLRRGLIRALHHRSFVDDPTRILRALRYSLRLGFEMDANTVDWINAGLPYLERVSGQRLSNEIDLILLEPKAGETMLRLQDMGALVRIHPAFRIGPQLPEFISRCQKFTPPWSTETIDRHTLRWIASMHGIGSREVQDLCERLALSNAQTRAITTSARLAEIVHLLDNAALRPSCVTQLLDDFPESALQAGWLLSADKAAVQDLIAKYASDWRQRRPLLNGDDLKAKGIAPGPIFRRMLDRLRFAWIDRDICSAEDEAALLQQLINHED